MKHVGAMAVRIECDDVGWRSEGGFQKKAGQEGAGRHIRIHLGHLKGVRNSRLTGKPQFSG